jgi:hypothetical protein
MLAYGGPLMMRRSQASQPTHLRSFQPPLLGRIHPTVTQPYKMTPRTGELHSLGVNQYLDDNYIHLHVRLPDPQEAGYIKG